MSNVDTIPYDIIYHLLDHVPLRIIGLLGCSCSDLKSLTTDYLSNHQNLECFENQEFIYPHYEDLRTYILYRINLDRHSPKRFFKIIRPDGQKKIIYSNSYWTYYKNSFFEYFDRENIQITEKTPIRVENPRIVPNVVYEILAKLNLLNPFISTIHRICGFLDEERDLLFEGSDIAIIIQHEELIESHREHIVRVYKKIDLDYILSEVAVYAVDEDGYYDEESFLNDPLDYLQIESTDNLSLEDWLLIYAISQTTVIPIVEL